jgi:hypothetical protein
MKANENDNKGTEPVVRNGDDERPRVEAENEAEGSELQEPQATGFTAQLRQLMRRSPQGEARSNVKRDQLKIDRTKSFLLLAGLTVVHSLRCFPHPVAPGAEMWPKTDVRTWAAGRGLIIQTNPIP